MVRWRFLIPTLAVLTLAQLFGGAAEPKAFAQKKQPKQQVATPAEELQTAIRMKPDSAMVTP